jgi:hypothetical protein
VLSEVSHVIGCIHGLYFGPQDACSTFFRNVELLPGYMASHPRIEVPILAVLRFTVQTPVFNCGASHSICTGRYVAMLAFASYALCTVGSTVNVRGWIKQ